METEAKANHGARQKRDFVEVDLITRNMRRDGEQQQEAVCVRLPECLSVSRHRHRSHQTDTT